MTREERNKYYDKAMSLWGEDAQINQMLEEMGELIVALNKYRRCVHYSPEKMEATMDNLFEEIADVKICLEQMENHFGNDKSEEYFYKKFQKLINYLKN